MNIFPDIVTVVSMFGSQITRKTNLFLLIAFDKLCLGLVKVTATGTITLFYLITELLPFVTFSCLQNNLKSTGKSLIKIHTMVKYNERQCSVQEP